MSRYKVDKVVELAESFVGKVRYVFGAESPEKGESDCSGFTKYIYKQVGYDLPRTTGGVWTSDLPTVYRNELQKGDLILFRDTYDSGYKDGVSHIGIYMGDNNFIHCATGGVKVSSLNENYYSKRFLGAKRVISSGDIYAGEEITANPTLESSPAIGLEWWGDIVKVVFIALLIIAGVTMFVLGIKDIALKEVL